MLFDSQVLQVNPTQPDYNEEGPKKRRVSGAGFNFFLYVYLRMLLLCDIGKYWTAKYLGGKVEWRMY